MSETKSEWKYLATTAFLVATIAVPTLASLLSLSDSDRSGHMVLRPNEQKVREPASLPSLGTPKKTVVIEDAHKELNHLVTDNALTYDLRCAKAKTTEFKVDGNYLQLKGKDCAKNSEMPKLSITNKTNGFTAAVFMMEGKEYQTDLIQLKEGENQIVIQYKTTTGQVEEQVIRVNSGKVEAL